MRRKPGRARARIAVLAALFMVVAAAPAATVPDGFVDGIYVRVPSDATAMKFARDGRLFIAQQSGKLRVVQNGTLLATPFLTVSVNSSGERGLLGIAFDPNFATNRFVYVYYTATRPVIHNRVSRFTANGNVAVPGSEVVLLNLNPLSSATNHNGGAIHFGNDGKLYIAVGDNVNGANAQTLGNLFGKILRLNRDGTIPADNPFFAQASGVNRAIWARGLRNPFTTAFQYSTGGSSSTTSAREAGKKSTQAPPAPTTAGPSPRVGPTIPASGTPCLHTPTAAAAVSAQSPGARSTVPMHSRSSTTGSISSPITARAGSGD